MIKNRTNLMKLFGGSSLLLAATLLATGTVRAAASGRPGRGAELGSPSPEFMKPCENRRYGDTCKLVREKVTTPGACIPTRADPQRLFCAPGSRMRPPPVGMLQACLKKKENDPCTAPVKRHKVQGFCQGRPGVGLVCLRPPPPGLSRGGGPRLVGGDLQDVKKQEGPIAPGGGVKKGESFGVRGGR